MAPWKNNIHESDFLLGSANLATTNMEMPAFYRGRCVNVV